MSVELGKCWCGGKMIRLDCECYEDWAMYCTPERPGPGCPNGMVVCEREGEHIDPEPCQGECFQ